ncbi:hypothetical protein F4780DRAFT_19860 [Xylariomycetidae sp. FL0641]|nr:hypothetical protein F4780DRAFT_19860 [Xylariomycetidae sp. FL0641]
MFGRPISLTDTRPRRRPAAVPGSHFQTLQILLTSDRLVILADTRPRRRPASSSARWLPTFLLFISLLGLRYHASTTSHSFAVLLALVCCCPPLASFLPRSEWLPSLVDLRFAHRLPCRPAVLPSCRPAVRLSAVQLFSCCPSALPASFWPRCPACSCARCFPVKSVPGSGLGVVPTCQNHPSSCRHAVMLSGRHGIRVLGWHARLSSYPAIPFCLLRSGGLVQVVHVVTVMLPVNSAPPSRLCCVCRSVEAVWPSHRPTVPLSGSETAVQLPRCQHFPLFAPAGLFSWST